MVMQSSDAAGGRFAALSIRQRLLGFRGRCAFAARQAAEGAGPAEDAGRAQLKAACSAPAHLKSYTFGDASVPTTLKSHPSGSSRYTAKFGGESEWGETCHSLDRGEGSLGWPALEKPEPGMEAVRHLPIGFAADGLEQVSHLDTMTSKPCHTGSFAPVTSPASPEGSLQSKDTVCLDIVESNQAAPHSGVTRISLIAAADIIEEVPYLNAVTGKPYYMDSLATTAGLKSQEGSLHSDDAAALMDSSQAAP